MKKISLIFCLLLTLFLMSCDTCAQIALEPCHTWNGYQVVYVNHVPHYRHYDGRIWYTHPIPPHERHRIVMLPPRGRQDFGRKPHFRPSEGFRSSTRHNQPQPPRNERREPKKGHFGGNRH